MAEPVDWLEDGTPRSPRFPDMDPCAADGLAQARHVFVDGCGLPGAWAGQRQWRILETGFGTGLNFLAAWRAWKDDPARCGLLHFTSIEARPAAAADLLRTAAAHPELLPLAEALAAQWWGLVPGFHRLVFEDGRVLLTLCVGELQPMLRELEFQADAVFLAGVQPPLDAPTWELGTLKAVARLCRHGTAVAASHVADMRQHLAQCGFVVEQAPGLPPQRDCLRGAYAPAWQVRGRRDMPDTQPGRCAVVGAGLAGAAVAASLARRGWQVEVLDAAPRPAAGASGLPAGLMAPHQSPDDNPLSRLSRAGVRMTRQQAASLLVQGQDWGATGVLQNRRQDRRPPPALGPDGDAWVRPGAAGQAASAGLPASQPAWWHEKGIWVRPGALVEAWLQAPGVTFRGASDVASADRAEDGSWCLRTADGSVLARADLVVLCAARGSQALSAGRLALHPVRGQVSWDWLDGSELLPPFPLNGNGHFIPRAPVQGRPAWLSGATYGRADASTDVRPEDHTANLARVRELAPAVAEQLAPRFGSGRVQAWTGVRCASSDRKPLVGWLEPGLAVSTALGSRGLTFCVLAAELLAARLHAEPLPLPARLAQALDLRRGPARD